MYSKEDMLIAKCSICGSEMECPDSMVRADTHLCGECTMGMASKTVKKNAAELAEIEKDVEKHKEEIRRLGEFIHETALGANMPPPDKIKAESKEEIAEYMHFTGIMTTIDFFMYSGLRGTDIKAMLKKIESNKKYAKNDEAFQQFAKETQNVINVIGAVGEKLDKMGVKGKEFDKIIKSVDPKAFGKLGNLDSKKEEDMAAIMNRLLFRGDWQKQLEWTEKHGTSRDVEAVKRGDGEGLI